MTSQKGTTQSDNPPIQKKVATHPTIEKLSELACLLSKNESDEPGTLVKRALGIWSAANDELSGIQQYQESDQIKFSEIAEKEWLPSIHKKTESVRSSKGVKKAVDRYFALLVKDYDQAMKERRIDSQKLKTSKEQIKQLWKEIADEKKMPKRVLDLLAKFHSDLCNTKSHQVSADEIGEVGDVDIGLPPSSDI